MAKDNKNQDKGLKYSLLRESTAHMGDDTLKNIAEDGSYTKAQRAAAADELKGRK